MIGDFRVSLLEGRGGLPMIWITIGLPVLKNHPSSSPLQT